MKVAKNTLKIISSPNVTICIELPWHCRVSWRGCNGVISRAGYNCGTQNGYNL